jgi:hypothetical protein
VSHAGHLIWEQRWRLEQARRERERVVMAEFDAQHAAAMQQLQAECAALPGGHSWHHQAYTMQGASRQLCQRCGLARAVSEPDE